MTVLASLQKKTRKGLAHWKFVDADGEFYAENDHKRLLADSVEELRELYKRFLSYGFTSV
jgi:hypothetical protein